MIYNDRIDLFGLLDGLPFGSITNGSIYLSIKNKLIPSKQKYRVLIEAKIKDKGVESSYQMEFKPTEKMLFSELINGVKGSDWKGVIIYFRDDFMEDVGSDKELLSAYAYVSCNIERKSKKRR